MQQFHFDIREGDRHFKDELGLSLPDLSAAEKVACRAAAEIGREVMPKGIREVAV